ncbi:MAG: bifunctional folylpolyglutamate synthase/dihydrofolate synthase [Deltaproteobacteria bacterium]|nr:MAG: bifunctional folylpolyglutamate synthase/dihydrofolate synthase [Deltaproteobacteria bacterium]
MSGDDAYVRTLAWLYAREARAGIDLKLARVEAAAARLGHPQRAAAALHVGGTNGKGSTAAMLDAIVRAAGRRVGLYTSPHLVSFRERITIDGVPIAEDEVVEGIGRLRRDLDDARGLTAFEVMTLLAWITFAAQRVEVQVLEVGLGGRLDATNVVVPAVAVITNVGRDHEQYLGDTITAIASEKAGIVKPGVPVVSGACGESADVIAARAAALGSPLSVLGRDFGIAAEPLQDRSAAAADAAAADTSAAHRFAARPQHTLVYRSADGTIDGLRIALAGRHQRDNAALALRALELAPQLTVTPAAMRAGLAGVRWPGRLQVVRRAPDVILDGAHNPAGIDVLVEEVRALAAGRPVRVLFGVMRDKAWPQMLRALDAIAAEIVVTRPRQARSADPNEVATAAPRPVPVVADPMHAYEELVARSGRYDVVLVTGSLFLVGDVLAAIDPAVARDAERERAAARLAAGG